MTSKSVQVELNALTGMITASGTVDQIDDIIAALQNNRDTAQIASLKGRINNLSPEADYDVISEAFETLAKVMDAGVGDPSVWIVAINKIAELLGWQMSAVQYGLAMAQDRLGFAPKSHNV